MDRAFARSVNKEKTAMRKMIITAVGAVALIGSARAEHVNLWPLYYSDGSTASIAWPLVSYKDGDEWRVGTIYREHSGWGVFPFYMDFGSSVVLTPFVVAKDWSGGAILPLAYADFKGDDTFWTVFPAVYSHRWKDGENSTFWAAAGLAGRKVRGGETESHWLAPLWWRWPKERRGILAAGLAGWDHLRDDEKCDWLLPFYWRNQDIFCSIPYGRIDESEKTTLNWWGLPLLQTRSGACHGFGIQPLVEYKRDRKLDVLEKAMDADRLSNVQDVESPQSPIRSGADASIARTAIKSSFARTRSPAMFFCSRGGATGPLDSTRSPERAKEFQRAARRISLALSGTPTGGKRTGRLFRPSRAFSGACGARSSRTDIPRSTSFRGSAANATRTAGRRHRSSGGSSATRTTRRKAQASIFSSSRCGDNGVVNGIMRKQVLDRINKINRIMGNVGNILNLVNPVNPV